MGFEIKRQARGNDVPKIAVFHFSGMQFSADQCGKCGISTAGCVGDRIVKQPNKMISQGDEIIALGLIATTDFVRIKDAVGSCRMGVQVAAKKFTGRGEKTGRHWVGSQTIMHTIHA